MSEPKVITTCRVWPWPTNYERMMTDIRITNRTKFSTREIKSIVTEALARRGYDDNYTFVLKVRKGQKSNWRYSSDFSTSVVYLKRSMLDDPAGVSHAVAKVAGRENIHEKWPAADWVEDGYLLSPIPKPKKPTTVEVRLERESVAKAHVERLGRELVELAEQYERDKKRKTKLLAKWRKKVKYYAKANSELHEAADFGERLRNKAADLEAEKSLENDLTA